MKTLKATLLETVQKRFCDIDSERLCDIATVHDPRWVNFIHTFFTFLCVCLCVRVHPAVSLLERIKEQVRKQASIETWWTCICSSPQLYSALQSVTVHCFVVLVHSHRSHGIVLGHSRQLFSVIILSKPTLHQHQTADGQFKTSWRTRGSIEQLKSKIFPWRVGSYQTDLEESEYWTCMDLWTQTLQL